MTPMWCGSITSASIFRSKRPRIADWLARIEARPSFDEAMVRWYEPSYLELFDRVRPNARARLKSLIHRA